MYLMPVRNLSMPEKVSILTSVVIQGKSRPEDKRSKVEY
jgi:hypothetical protein